MNSQSKESLWGAAALVAFLAGGFAIGYLQGAEDATSQAQAQIATCTAAVADYATKFKAQQADFERLNARVRAATADNKKVLARARELGMIP